MAKCLAEVSCLGKSNALNLDVDVLGEGLDGDAAAGGLVGEPLLVLAVHLLHSLLVCFKCEAVAACTYGKVSHVGDEDHGLDDLGDGRASLLEDGIEVLAALAGLVGNGALDKSTLSVERDSARAVDGVGGLDGLGLLRVSRASGGVFHHESSLRRGRRLSGGMLARVSWHTEVRLNLRAGALAVKMLVCSAILEDVRKDAEKGVNNLGLARDDQRRAEQAALRATNDIPGK